MRNPRHPLPSLSNLLFLLSTHFGNQGAANYKTLMEAGVDSGRLEGRTKFAHS